MLDAVARWDGDRELLTSRLRSHPPGKWLVRVVEAGSWKGRLFKVVQPTYCAFSLRPGEQHPLCLVGVIAAAERSTEEVAQTAVRSSEGTVTPTQYIPPIGIHFHPTAGALETAPDVPITVMLTSHLWT
jgi:hypothetical protein